MTFNSDELADIRDALYAKVGRLGESLETLSDVIKTLDGGGTVPLFAPGAQGVRAAQDMHKGMRVHRDRLQALAERTYPDEA